MFRRFFLISFLIAIGVFTVLYFVDDGVLKKAELTAIQAKGGLKQKVEEAKESGEEFVKEVSTRAQQEKMKIDNYLDTKKQKAKEVVDSTESFWDSTVLKMTRVVERIKINATNIYNLF